MSTIQQSDLKAVLQKYYGRFIASIEFVKAENGEIVIQVFFADGDVERLIKGKQNEQNSGNHFRYSAGLAYSPA